VDRAGPRRPPGDAGIVGADLNVLVIVGGQEHTESEYL
jgi:hypothetical protein